MKLLDLLDTAAWAQSEFGSLTSGGPIRLRDLRRAERRSFVRSVGLVSLTDDNGFTFEPERFREGFVLTDNGRKFMKQNDERMHHYQRGQAAITGLVL